MDGTTTRAAAAVALWGKRADGFATGSGGGGCLLVVEDHGRGEWMKGSGCCCYLPRRRAMRPALEVIILTGTFFAND